jgi:hypothetical protein
MSPEKPCTAERGHADAAVIHWLSAVHPAVEPRRCKLPQTARIQKEICLSTPFTCVLQPPSSFPGFFSDIIEPYLCLVTTFSPPRGLFFAGGLANLRPLPCHGSWARPTTCSSIVRVYYFKFIGCLWIGSVRCFRPSKRLR